MNYEEDIKKNKMVLEIGDRVIYVPTHANGDINHKDCEYGIIKSWNSTGIFVNYVRNGIPQMTAQHTRPKAVVTYDTKEDMERALKADDTFSFIWDFQQYLRGQWKYGNPPDDIQVIYDKWFETLRDHSIDMDIYP